MDFKETHLDDFKTPPQPKLRSIETFSWIMLAVTVGLVVTFWL
jgi:hypothetical protein